VKRWEKVRRERREYEPVEKKRDTERWFGSDCGGPFQGYFGPFVYDVYCIVFFLLTWKT
jgi:hypothetical protein